MFLHWSKNSFTQGALLLFHETRSRSAVSGARGGPDCCFSRVADSSRDVVEISASQEYLLLSDWTPPPSSGVNFFSDSIFAILLGQCSMKRARFLPQELPNPHLSMLRQQMPPCPGALPRHSLTAPILCFDPLTLSFPSRPRREASPPKRTHARTYIHIHTHTHVHMD